jgi:hypothetical protein
MRIRWRRIRKTIKQGKCEMTRDGGEEIDEMEGCCLEASLLRVLWCFHCHEGDQQPVAFFSHPPSVPPFPLLHLIAPHLILIHPCPPPPRSSSSSSSFSPSSATTSSSTSTSSSAHLRTAPALGPYVTTIVPEICSSRTAGRVKPTKASNAAGCISCSLLDLPSQTRSASSPD